MSSAQSLDTNETAKYTGLSRSTLEKLRLYGGGPPFLKLGRLVRYRVTDLDTWLDARLMLTTSTRAYSDQANAIQSPRPRI